MGKEFPNMPEASSLRPDILLPPDTPPPLHPEPPSCGRLVYVMGASGSGKDSLLEHLRLLSPGLPLAFAVRYITRPDTGGTERHIPLNPERFASLAGQGFFALHWSSHGRRYGISAASTLVLDQGLSLLVNGSRAAFPQALRLFPNLLPVLVSAPTHLLRARLLARGRESGPELETRLQSANMPIPGEEHASDWIRIDNSASLHDAALALAKELRKRLRLP